MFHLIWSLFPRKLSIKSKQISGTTKPNLKKERNKKKITTAITHMNCHFWPFLQPLFQFSVYLPILQPQQFDHNQRWQEQSLTCSLCCHIYLSDCGTLVTCETKSDWLTRAGQTESSSNHLSQLFFTTLFGLLTRWMLKINAVNSENLPAGVPGDFILFIYLIISFFFFFSD